MLPPPKATTGEEPRYNGVDVQRSLIAEPGTSGLNGSSSSHSATSVLLSGGDATTSLRTTKLTRDAGSHDDANDPTAQIDPPEGFQPSLTRPESLQVDKDKHLYDNNVSTPTSSISSSLSISSSNANSTLNRIQTGHNKGPQHNDSNINGQLQTSNTTTISSTRSHQPTENQETNGAQARINNSHDTHNGMTNKDVEPTPSTSAHRFVNGINSIVTKITRVLHNTSLSMISTDRCLQEEVPKFAFAHKRSLEKTWKLMDKVVKCCQRPLMNLNNSPPFILEILPETYQHLKQIHTLYESTKNYPINDNDYSQVFLRNLQNRCKQTLKLFKDAKDEMFDIESEYRHKLTRNTLVFNHILSELKAIFPRGQFIGEKYLITKKEGAGEFWKNNFGSSVLVDWKSFYHALQQVHNIDSSFFSLHALKQTVDLTCDDYISIFEFDVFTRLFQPWSSLLLNWQILAVTHPGYKAFLTYDELKARLQKHIDKPGSYVYRLSCTKLGQWAIGYVTSEGQILQTIVQNISLSQALTDKKNYLYPDGKDEDPSLEALCSDMAGAERNVTVTEEQYEIYCGVGNSFQTCKICFENDKDVRVEPCNHLLCSPCLVAWQESEGQGCPYCRTEIKETVHITMNLPIVESSGSKSR